MARNNIHGHTVEIEDDAEDGRRYLEEDIQYKEAQVFFEQAKYRGETQFEDDHDHQFTLSYNGDGTYTLSKRKSSGGLFGGWV